jgi:hypothetical protein
MIFSNDQTTNDALVYTLGEEQAAAWVREEQAAAWVRFYAIEVDTLTVSDCFDGSFEQMPAMVSATLCTASQSCAL